LQAIAFLVKTLLVLAAAVSELIDQPYETFGVVAAIVVVEIRAAVVVSAS
jgi:hypothetical protein